MLIYPMLDATVSSASYDHNEQDYIIACDTPLSGYEMYMSQTDPLHPKANPLWCEGFNGLPPTYIVTAEFDPLRDKGEVLYQRFQEQDADCTCQRYLGVIHGFFQLAGMSQATRSAVRDVVQRTIDSTVIRHA